MKNEKWQWEACGQAWNKNKMWPSIQMVFWKLRPCNCWNQLNGQIKFVVEVKLYFTESWQDIPNFASQFSILRTIKLKILRDDWIYIHKNKLL